MLNFMATILIISIEAFSFNYIEVHSQVRQLKLTACMTIADKTKVNH